MFFSNQILARLQDIRQMRDHHVTSMGANFYKRGQLLRGEHYLDDLQDKRYSPFVSNNMELLRCH